MKEMNLTKSLLVLKVSTTYHDISLSVPTGTIICQKFFPGESLDRFKRSQVLYLPHALIGQMLPFASLTPGAREGLEKMLVKIPGEGERLGLKLTIVEDPVVTHFATEGGHMLTMFEVGVHVGGRM